MSLANYPILAQVYEDLTRLTVSESADEPARNRARLRIYDGQHVKEFRYPGLGRFMLTVAQIRVVRELMAALVDSDEPDVCQQHLIRISGMRASRLSEVFAGSRAWGTLVVQGERAGCYRHADHPR